MKKYLYDQKPATTIHADSVQNYKDILSHDVTCLIGPNNSGKSFLLKKMTEELNGVGTYLGPARYSNFNTLAPYARQPGRKKRKFQSLINSIRNNSENVDNSPFNIQQAIAELSDNERKSLFYTVETVMGAHLALDLADTNNQMSQRYISVDGHNFSFASSGTRLIVSILTSLLDRDYTFFLIDEPELGISPEAQTQLANFIFDSDNRKKLFPHVEHVVFATHSTIFLNRLDITKNYTIQKDGDNIHIKRLESLADFNRIHFSLLGNNLQKLFLPNFILFVEGPTEELFISRALTVKYPQLNFSTINATNDSEMKRYAHMLSQIFPDLQNSPYRDRIFPILDFNHGKGIKDTLVKQGIQEENIVIWSRNGIEYFYPPTIMDSVYGAGGRLSIIGDEVTRNGTTLRKLELARRVSDALKPETAHHAELVEKLFGGIEREL